MNIKDIKIGQTVYIKLIGNASRNKDENALIEEWEITYVGKKLIKAKHKGWDNGFEETFEKRNNGNKEQFVQKTNYCVNYVLYFDKQEILDEFERNNLFQEICNYFRGYDNKLSLEKLRKISEIIKNE